MATTKKKVHHMPAKRKPTGLTTAAKGAVTKRKKRRAKKKDMLSEMVSPERAKQSGKAVFSGAVGGASIHVVEKLYPETWGTGAKVLAGLTISFVTGAVFDMPNMSAGMAGAVGYKAAEDHLLLAEEENEEMEEAEFTDAEVLEEMPEYLSADGGALMEDANGNLYSLSERNQVQYYSPYNRQA